MLLTVDPFGSQPMMLNIDRSVYDVKSDEKIHFFNTKVLQMYRNGAIIMLYNCIKQYGGTL